MSNFHQTTVYIFVNHNYQEILYHIILYHGIITTIQHVHTYGCMCVAVLEIAVGHWPFSDQF